MLWAMRHGHVALWGYGALSGTEVEPHSVDPSGIWNSACSMMSAGGSGRLL